MMQWLVYGNIKLLATISHFKWDLNIDQVKTPIRQKCQIRRVFFFYASANEVAGGIMFSGRPSVRTYVRPSVPFCLCRYFKNRVAVLHQTWYEGIS